jgi:NAD(P)-dependent dehydrogenase (short-subunit alcohol dehydrogenase family)
MRKVIVLGASSSLAVRLAAELAMHDVHVIVAEGQETARAAARALGVDDMETIVRAHDAVEDAGLGISEDVFVLGSSSSRVSRAMQEMALELSRYQIAEPTIEPYMLPQTQSSHPYWQQGTPAFHRKQQSMRAKARRR